MFRKTQMEKREEKPGKLDFFSLTRKYWKEQIFFYVVTTLSCVGSFVFDQNWMQISNRKQRIVFLNYSEDFSENFQALKGRYISLVLLGLSLYFLIVFVHVWFAYHLEAKIHKHLKKLIIQKMFKLEGFHNKQKVSSLLNYSVRLFSKNVLYIPNQVYYATTEIMIVLANSFLTNKKGKGFGAIKSIRFLFFCYFFLFLFACAILQVILYYSELRYHNSVENEVRNELFLIDNRDLMIKKSETSRFFRVYSRSLDNVFNSAFIRNLSEALSFVYPSYFLLKFFPFLCLYYVNDPTESVVNSVISFSSVFNNIRKIIERGRDFPFYYSSWRKINEFLSEKERDDKQNGQVITGYIQSIEFKDIAFAYYNEGGVEKKVLNDFSTSFKVGKINEMNFPNGFGKSTIINLVTGMLQPQTGEVLINETHRLSNINTDWWRSIISYSEHRNLISRLDLSTGQKQLIDLNNAFGNVEKQVFIFDEADSNLDHKNRNEFLRRLEVLSAGKLVILVSHHT